VRVAPGRARVAIIAQVKSTPSVKLLGFVCPEIEACLSERSPSTPLLSVVVPVYCCARCLRELAQRVFAALDPIGTVELVLVCDASPDDSWAEIRAMAEADARVRGLLLSRNFGQHCAISAGIENARGTWVYVMDCDLQDPPEDMPALWQAAQAGNDIVLGQRLERQDHALKRAGSALFYRLLGFLTDTRFDASVANFGIYHRRVIDTINAMPERARFFPLMVRWTGFRSATVPVQHARRSHGASSYSFGKLLRLGVDVILSYSDKPLRLVVKLGFVVSMIALLIALMAVYGYAIGEITVAGFTSLLASIWLLGGMLLSCVGVIGLYVGRIHSDVKKRPYYVVQAIEERL
jgi:polyisoprenyl-phosphate glycosyltransferase